MFENHSYSDHFVISEKQKIADIRAVRRAIEEREKVCAELEVCHALLGVGIASRDLGTERPMDH